MPLYEYICSACKEKTTLLQKVDEEPLVCCPKCHSNALEKQFSTISVHQERDCDHSCESSTKNSCSHTGGCSCCY
jgi:putative FmdB family regulatory protein